MITDLQTWYMNPVVNFCNAQKYMGDLDIITKITGLQIVEKSCI